MTRTVPLWGIFIIQSLVVAGAFVAVILVLTLQQRSDFQDALFKELSLRQVNTRESFLAPARQEEALMNALVDDLSKNTDRRAILTDDTDTLDDLRDFYNGGDAVRHPHHLHWPIRSKLDDASDVQGVQCALLQSCRRPGWWRGAALQEQQLEYVGCPAGRWLPSLPPFKC